MSQSLWMVISRQNGYLKWFSFQKVVMSTSLPSMQNYEGNAKGR